MSILAILGLIMSVVQALPQAIALVKEIIVTLRSIFHGGVDRSTETKRQLLGEFKAALQQAREKKDAQPLEAFHKKLSDLGASGVHDLSAMRAPFLG